MNAIPRDDELMADTPHARLGRTLVRSGAFREPRFERLSEAAAYLHSTVTGQTKNLPDVLKGSRFPKSRDEAKVKAAEASLDCFLYYADTLTVAEAAKLYDYAQAILNRRQLGISGAALGLSS